MPLSVLLVELSHNNSWVIPFIEELRFMDPMGYWKPKDTRGMNMIDEAYYAKHNPLMEWLYQTESKRYYKEAQEISSVVGKQLANMPDFSYDLYYELDNTVIPIIIAGLLLKADTVKVCKFG